MTSYGIKKVLLLSVISLVIISAVSGQIKKTGLMYGAGFGFGLSKHAGSYQSETILNQIETFSSFRIIALDFKAGWGFGPVQTFYTLKVTPANTTISPYKSFYQGILISYSSQNNLIYSAGAGINKAGDKTGSLSRGTLANLVLGYEFNPKFLLEVNLLFGKMENSPPPDTYLNSNNEFSFVLTINYLFYRDAQE
jgi:hypothetical protein